MRSEQLVRELTYAQAIQEGLHQAMDAAPNVFPIGEVVRDPKTGKPVTRWDGVTVKTSPVTGEDVPDESAQVATYQYVNPRKAEWPAADFIIGNPPYLGKGEKIMAALGVGYVERFAILGADVGRVDNG